MKFSYQFYSIAVLLPLLALLAGAGTATAIHPSVTKLHARGAANPLNHRFGDAVALSDRFLLVGEPGNSEVEHAAGAVHVFDVSTGRYLRKLAAPDPGDGVEFGISVAVEGWLGLVGARGADGGGAAYLYDLRTGRVLVKLSPADAPATNSNFGISVALDGDLALIGASDHPGNGAFSGAAYVFRVPDGQQIRILSPTGAAAGDRFGNSVALRGGLALIGAFGRQSLRGAAYLLDARTGQQVRLITAADGVGGDQFGLSVSLDAGRVLIGAPSQDAVSNQGAAYLYDLGSGVLLRKLIAETPFLNQKVGISVALQGSLAAVAFNLSPGGALLFDTTTGKQLRWLNRPTRFDFNSGAGAVRGSEDRYLGEGIGTSVALWGNTVALGAGGDHDRAYEAGAAYLFRALADPLPLTSTAKVGDFAPGGVDVAFRGWGAAVINPEGAAVFGALLGGGGSNRNRDSGIWTEVRAASGKGPLRASLKSRDPLAGALTGLQAGSPGPPVANQPSRLLFASTLAGPGASRTNNLAVFRDAGSGAAGMLRSGEPAAALGGAAAAAFRDLVQTHNPGQGFALAYELRQGIAGVNRENDSGVIRLSDSGAAAADFREGGNLPVGAGLKYGQFFGRVSHGDVDEVVFPAHVTGGGVPFQRLFRSGEEVFSQGASFTGPAGPKIRSFLGESSVMVSGAALARVTLAGGGAVSRTNELIYSEKQSSVVARKGDPVPGEAAGVVWGGFLGFWPVEADRVVLWVRLAGPGVNRNNDLALYLSQEDQSLLKLLREGDSASGGDGSRVGVIQRVDVHPVSGDYVVLASLTGDRARNQALFAGDTGAGNATTQKALRLPQMRQRKGTLHDSPAGGATTGIRSLTLSPTTDRGGAGGKGLGQVINAAGEIILGVEYDNRRRELATGKP